MVFLIVLALQILGCQGANQEPVVVIGSGETWSDHNNVGRQTLKDYVASNVTVYLEIQ
jgi:hypothetical protein